MSSMSNIVIRMIPQPTKREGSQSQVSTSVEMNNDSKPHGENADFLIGITQESMLLVNLVSKPIVGYDVKVCRL